MAHSLSCSNNWGVNGNTPHENNEKYCNWWGVVYGVILLNLRRQGFSKILWSDFRCGVCCCQLQVLSLGSQPLNLHFGKDSSLRMTAWTAILYASNKHWSKIYPTTAWWYCPLLRVCRSEIVNTKIVCLEQRNHEYTNPMFFIFPMQFRSSQSRPVLLHHDQRPRVHDPCTIESSLYGLDGLQNQRIFLTRVPRRVILADGVMMRNSAVVLEDSVRETAFERIPLSKQYRQK